MLMLPKGLPQELLATAAAAASQALTLHSWFSPLAWLWGEEAGLLVEGAKVEVVVGKTAGSTSKCLASYLFRASCDSLATSGSIFAFHLFWMWLLALPLARAFCVICSNGGSTALRLLPTGDAGQLPLLVRPCTTTVAALG